MKRILIAGTSLTAVAAAGAAGAVDITLGGSIDMGVEYGVGKNHGSLSLGDAYNIAALRLGAAGTTDAGLVYGGSFTLATKVELEFNPYEDDLNGDGDFNDANEKKLFKYTVKNYTDLEAAAYNVSGGQKLNADSIVAVKINSEWKSVSNNTRTLYGEPLPEFASSNVCKIAGRANLAGVPNIHDNLADPGQYIPGGLGLARMNANRTAVADIAYLGARTALDTSNVNNPPSRYHDPTNLIEVNAGAAADGYFPAGRLAQLATNEGADAADTLGLDVKLVLTAATSAANSGKVFVTGQNPLGQAHKGAAASALNDKFNVFIANHEILNGDAADDLFAPNPADGVPANAPGHYRASAFGPDDVKVESAAVYAGPFMSVKLQSSSTKMVIGAVCVSGNESSKTAVYMNNASKVVTASDASIFVEGGFGKLTLQTGDYAGGVAGIGDAGDQADIDAGGVVAIIEGVGLLGANPYVAVDLSKDSSLNSLEVLSGGTIDMGGLTAAVDVKLDNAEGVIGIGSWDLGLGYSMGDADVSFVVDSANDWGMKASMDVAGFGVDATIYNKAAEDHKKNGLFYSVSASTDLNGFGLSLSVDQDMKPKVGVSYDMDWINIYAGYSAAEQGGKIGAKLSF